MTTPKTFSAFRLRKDNNAVTAKLESVALSELSNGNVVIQVEWSSVNYKDALAASPNGQIARQYPLIGGIDAAGIVIQSSDTRYAEGDEVVVTGYGLSQTHDGGYSAYLRVPADWIVPLPNGLSLRDTMIIGTAGFTAALARYRMEQNGQSPDQGPIVVTGASGGVGSFSIQFFSQAGYEVIAVSGKPSASEYLTRLGASQIIARNDFNLGDKPMEKALYGGAVDSVGGDTLSGLTRMVTPWGNIASIGLAGGHKLNTTVMPFILRGISLLGITSAGCPSTMRQAIWEKLANEWKPTELDSIVSAEISLNELKPTFERMLAGKMQGRTIVRIQG